MLPPPCLTVGMVFLGSYSAFFPLQTQQVELMPKSLIWSHLTTSCLPILLRIIQVFIGKLQTALYMCLLEQCDLASAAVLHIITTQCVANGFLGDCGPSCLEIIHKLPLCGSGVILHLSDDHRYRTRGYLALSPRPRAIDSCLVR